MQNAQLMQRAMAENGRLAQQIISPEITRFAALPLTGAERLSAIAGLIASVASQRHAGASALFLQQLQDLTRLGAGATSFAEHEPPAAQRSEAISAAIAILIDGFDRLATDLAAAGVEQKTAAAVEAVLVSRLLAGHRPHRIRLALLACAVALAQPSFCPGDLVPFLPADASGAAPALTPAAAGRTGTDG